MIGESRFFSPFGPPFEISDSEKFFVANFKNIYRTFKLINFIGKFQISADFVEKPARKPMVKLHYLGYWPEEKFKK